MNRFGAIVAAALVAGSLAGASAGGGHRVSRDPLRVAINELVAAGVPGVGVYVRGRGDPRFLTAGFGDRGRRVRIRLTDRFRIASVSKTFNAATVVSLARSGRLKLGDRVTRWLPRLLAHGGEITIRELLGHTSGLPDYTKQPAFLQQVGRDLQRSWRPRELVAFVASKALAFRPGTEYEYSDTDNIVLGLIVEAATKRSYATALRARVLRPLGLRSTTLPTTSRMPGRHIHGYQYEPGGRGEADDVTTLLNPTGAWASGAMISTLPDLSRFFSSLLRGRLVGRSLLARMKQTVPGGGSPPGPGTNRAGLGIFRYRLPCGVVWGHTGSFPGYRLFAAASADGRRSIAFVSNATNTSPRADRAAVRVQELAVCRALKS